MNNIIRYIVVFQLVLVGTPSFACTVFYAAQGDMVLAGNNEDWMNPITKVWFEPAEKGKYGRVFFGFDDFYPQGGMNEKGLFFDVAAAKPVEIPTNPHMPPYEGNLIREKIMPECSTVIEAIQLFKRYRAPHRWKAMYILGDSTGNSAIIGPFGVIQKKGYYQVVTNFYQSKVKSGEISCERYKLAVDMLARCNNISVKDFRQILAATHTEGDYINTLYSNIYDLKKKLIYLYHFHNYQNEVIIDFKEEIKKGRHSYDLPSLFPKTYASESLIRIYKKIKTLNICELAPKTINDLIGIYEMPLELAPKTAFAITNRGDKIYGFYPESPYNELLPISSSQLLNISKNGVIKITLNRNKNGGVNKLTVETDQHNFTADKIK